MAHAPVIRAAPDVTTPPTPLGPIVAFTFLASLGTGVMWNGLAFVAESAFGYGRRESFLLAAFQGVVYVVAALAAGPLARAIASHVSQRSLLVLLALIQGLTAPLVLFTSGSAGLWLVAGVMSAASAVQWPVVESYLAAGRPGGAMRRAIGWWNVVWMAATALSVAATGPIIATGHPRLAIVVLTPICLLQLVAALRFGRVPGDHMHDASEPVPASYARHLQAARVMLPISYVVVAALSPLMAYVTDPFGLAAGTATILVSTWLVARLVAVTILWRTHGWHGRWATLFVAGGLIAVGFAAAVLAPSPAILVLGLLAFGLGQGTIYYAALYYALAVGNAEVDAAGTHEALIGLGYVVGPLIGVASTIGMAADSTQNWLAVGGIWMIMALSAWPALRPYLADRRERARSADRAAGPTASPPPSEARS